MLEKLRTIVKNTLLIIDEKAPYGKRRHYFSVYSTIQLQSALVTMRQIVYQNLNAGMAILRPTQDPASLDPEKY